MNLQTNKKIFAKRYQYFTWIMITAKDWNCSDYQHDSCVSLEQSCNKKILESSNMLGPPKYDWWKWLEWFMPPETDRGENWMLRGGPRHFHTWISEATVQQQFSHRPPPSQLSKVSDFKMHSREEKSIHTPLIRTCQDI